MVLRDARKRSGRGGARTLTGVTSHGILSPVRLPIPPLGPSRVQASMHLIDVRVNCQRSSVGQHHASRAPLPSARPVSRALRSLETNKKTARQSVDVEQLSSFLDHDEDQASPSSRLFRHSSPTRDLSSEERAESQASGWQATLEAELQAHVNSLGPESITSRSEFRVSCRSHRWWW